MSIQLPMQAAGRRSTFFEQEAIDHIMTMVVELATELWVVRERQYATEVVLDAVAPDLRSRIETWEPDAAQADELAAMRGRILGNLYRTLGIERPGPSEEAVVAAA